MTERPDSIPEKFWDAEKGEVRVDDLAKSYGELSALLGKPKSRAPESYTLPEGKGVDQLLTEDMRKDAMSLVDTAKELDMTQAQFEHAFEGRFGLAMSIDKDQFTEASAFLESLPEEMAKGFNVTIRTPDGISSILAMKKTMAEKAIPTNVNYRAADKSLDDMILERDTFVSESQGKGSGFYNQRAVQDKIRHMSQEIVKRRDVEETAKKAEQG